MEMQASYFIFLASVQQRSYAFASAPLESSASLNLSLKKEFWCCLRQVEWKWLEWNNQLKGVLGGNKETTYTEQMFSIKKYLWACANIMKYTKYPLVTAYSFFQAEGKHTGIFPLPEGHFCEKWVRVQKERKIGVASREMKGIKLRVDCRNLLCTLTPVLQTSKLIAVIQGNLNYWTVLITLGLKVYSENVLSEYWFSTQRSCIGYY